MRDTLSHRGPNDCGTWWSLDRRVGLAQRRLAIVDLSLAGHQPMTDGSGQTSITFNGEIYNHHDLRKELEACGHQFRSSSDTEVLLAAYRQWGVDCLERLNGMFAFCIYDQTTRRMFLARDRAGEKPLFYWHTPDKLVFASELKALMEFPDLPRRIDLEAFQFYLAFGYVPGSMCILQNVKKLPQGHAMTYDTVSGAMDVWQYWELPQLQTDPTNDEVELERELERLLENSVRRQIVADVPVGILLSGGIDSSLVTAMAARVSSDPVQTFNVSFAGHKQYDEAPYARLVARHFGTEHTELVVEPDVLEILPELARQYDEPMADSSMIPTFLVSKLIRQHATVALGGDGGDELFGGYYHYAWLLQLARRRRYIPKCLRTSLAFATRRLLPLGVKGRNYLLAQLAEPPQDIGRFNTFFDRQERRWLVPLLRRKAVREAPVESYKANLAYRFTSPLQQATAVDFMTYLVDDILVKVDRSSMLVSLEVRAPFLDHHIVEFAFRQIPDHLKTNLSDRKILPRRLAKRILPSELDLDRKQGFSLPLSAWFRGRWGDYVEEVLTNTDPDLFDRRAIDHLLYGQRLGFSNIHRLFALTIFELWRRQYKVHF